MSLPSKAATAFLTVSILIASATRDDSHDLLDLSVEGFPNCKAVASFTYPGFCDPSVSGFACYSLEANYTPLGKPNTSVEVHWACSPDLDVGDMTDESCKHRPWNFKGKASSGEELEFVAKDVYKGMCQFDASTRAQGTTEGSSQPKLALAPETAAPTTASETPAATGSKTPEPVPVPNPAPSSTTDPVPVPTQPPTPTTEHGAGAAQASTQGTQAPAPETPATTGSQTPEPVPSPSPSSTTDTVPMTSQPPTSTTEHSAGAAEASTQRTPAPVPETPAPTGSVVPEPAPSPRPNSTAHIGTWQAWMALGLTLLAWSDRMRL